MHIRPLTTADIPACATLMANTPLWQRYGVTVENATERISKSLREGIEILVAEDDEAHILGFVWMATRGAFSRSGYIPLLGVDEAHRGSGIGWRLLAAAEDRLSRNTRDIFLLCSHFNVDAQRFYERHGYERVGAIPDYVIPGVNEIIYRKRCHPR